MNVERFSLRRNIAFGAMMVLTGTTPVRMLSRGVVIPTPEPNLAPLAAANVAVVRTGN